MTTPHVDNYEFGRLEVDGVVETEDVILLPDRVVRDWRRIDGHSLVLEDLEEWLDELPERLILGTGAYDQLKPTPEVFEQLRKLGVKLEALATADAIIRYCELGPAETAAALHLTC